MQRIDASIGLNAGETYFFVGDTCINHNFFSNALAASYPKPITSRWKGVWSNLDAVVLGHGGSANKLYFFKGSQYLRYDLQSDRIDPGYPKSVSVWKGLWSSGVKAGIKLPTNNKYYFFRNDEYIRYDFDKGIDPGYPRKISSAWPGIWPDFENVCMGQGDRANKAYFFKGDQYLRYDVTESKVDPGYPKPLSVWKGLYKGLQSLENSEHGGSISITAGGDSSHREQEIGDVSKERTSVGYVCTTKKYKVDATFNENYLLSTTEHQLFPGNIISAQSYASGAIAPVIGKRQPYTISSSVLNSTNQVAQVKDGIASAAKVAIASILPFDQTTPAGVVSSSSIVKSEEDLMLALKASYSQGVATVTASGSFSRKTRSNVVAIKFLQTYYTIDVDNPSNLSSSTIFADQTQITDDMLIVSQVGYGRHLIFLVETDYSETDIEAAVKATSESIGSVEIDANYKKMLESSRINVFSIGGSASDTVRVIQSGVEGIKQYMKDGANFGKSNPGAPLFYKLNFLNSWKPANIRFSTEISRTECKQTSGKFRFSFDKLTVVAVNDPGDEEEIYGIGWCNLYVIPKGGTQAQRVMPGAFVYKDQYGRVLEILPKHAKSLKQGEYISLGPDIFFDIDVDDYGYDSLDELIRSDKAYFDITFEVKEEDDITADDIFPKERRRVFLRDANLSSELNAADGGSKVKIDFTIEPVAD